MRFKKITKKRDNPPDGGCFFDKILFLSLFTEQFGTFKIDGNIRDNSPE